MERSDIQSQAERYKREMLKLYGRRIPDEAGNTPGDSYDPEPQEPSMTDSDAPDDTAWAPHPDNDAEASDEADEDYNTRYPDPDLSELSDEADSMIPEDTEPPEYVSEESLGDSKGYILVNVRSGDESNAVAGATVMVTATVGGKRLILASGLTNASGTTVPFEVPVPAPGLSQSPSPDERPYNLFDVSVTAKGYFNARSVDVPVFPGITSVQNFSMIPVPAFMADSDETVTYYNQEPDFGSPEREGG